MRVSCVGLGSIGQRHIQNLLSLGCEVQAMDISEEARERTRSQFPTVKVSDFVRFDGVDALVICTPWDRHLEWVEAAIQRRIPFFTEKPLGSLEQLPRWREISSMDLPVNQVGYMLRAQVDASTLCGLGRPDVAQLTVKWPIESRHGPLLLESSHEIDLARYMGVNLLMRTMWAKKTTDGVVFGGDDWRITMGNGRYERRWLFRWGRVYSEAQFDDPKQLGSDMYLAEMDGFLVAVANGKCIKGLADVSDGVAAMNICSHVEALLAW